MEKKKLSNESENETNDELDTEQYFLESIECVNESTNMMLETCQEIGLCQMIESEELKTGLADIIKLLQTVLNALP